MIAQNCLSKIVYLSIRRRYLSHSSFGRPMSILERNTALKKLRENVADLPFVGNQSGRREQQLKEISRHRSDAGELSETEKNANRELTITWSH